MHAAQQRKPKREKDAETDRLYTYYVSRVRDVFEEHRRDHRRLFGQDYLCWAQPEREEPTSRVARRSRAMSRIEGTDGSADVDDASAQVQAQSAANTAVIKERRRRGSDCERGEESSLEGESVGDGEGALT